MNIEEENMEWEKDAPLLAAINKKNPFNVPSNYFEGLESAVKNQISLNNLIEVDDAFSVPQHYFDGLSKQILNQIKLEEIKPSILSKDFGFTTPNGYFEQQEKIILEAVHTDKKKVVRVIPIGFIRYAAAACILLMTSAGIYFNINQSKTLSSQLSKIPNEEIESYLQQHIDASDVSLIIENLPEKATFSTEQSKLSEAEIIQLLNTNP